MAMSAGTEPSTYKSELTELSKKIYDNLQSIGVYKQSNKPIKLNTIDKTDYYESQSDFEYRVLSDKREAYAIASAVIDYFKSKCDVSINGGQTVASYEAGIDAGTGAKLMAPGYQCAGTVVTPTASKLAGKVS